MKREEGTFVDNGKMADGKVPAEIFDDIVRTVAERVASRLFRVGKEEL